MPAVNWIIRRVFTARTRTRGFAAIAVAWVLNVGLWPLWIGIWLQDDPPGQSLREDLRPVLDWLFCRPPADYLGVAHADA